MIHRIWPPLHRRLVRILCHLFGCHYDCYTPGCSRCGADVYDYDSVQRGLLEPVFAKGRKMCSILAWPRCLSCGTRLKHYRSKEEFCCAECADTWLPF